MPATLTNAAEEVLVHLLKVDQAVTDLVRIDDERFRIGPDQCPIDWKDKTSIVYEQQADSRTRLVNGSEAGMCRATFSIYCIDRNRGRSRILAKAVRDAIACQGRQTIAEVLVLQVHVKDGERDESLPGTDGADQPERYRTLDCVITYIA